MVTADTVVYFAVGEIALVSEIAGSWQLHPALWLFGVLVLLAVADRLDEWRSP